MYIERLLLDIKFFRIEEKNLSGKLRPCLIKCIVGIYRPTYEMKYP